MDKSLQEATRRTLQFWKSRFQMSISVRLVLTVPMIAGQPLTKARLVWSSVFHIKNLHIVILIYFH